MNEERESYDQSATIFSPDGRMYQVEYAREAVLKGSISIGMVYKDGVLLMVEKRIPSPLVEIESYEKIFKLGDNIACSTSGLIADSRILVDYAREERMGYMNQYNEDLPISELVERISEIMRTYTQHAGIRPFGVSFLVGGIDTDGINLYETDPSGSYKKYRACVIGEGKAGIEEIFEKKYKDNMTFRGAINLALKAISKVLNRNINEINIDIVTITKKDMFKNIPDEEINDIRKKFKL